MKTQDTNKELKLLEVAMAAVKFLGLEERCEDPFVRRYDCANFVQVDLALQYCPETSYPTYELSAQLFLNPEGKIDSICVNEFQGSYYDYIREVDSLLEGYVGCYESVLKNTYYEDFSVGEIFLTGFGNLFFGLGSLIAGYPLDTALIALTEAMGVGAIFLDPIIGCDDILALTLAPSCFIFSACWAFICPVTYQKSVVRYAYGGYNEGFSFQFVPFEDNLGIKLSYRKTF